MDKHRQKQQLPAYRLVQLTNGAWSIHAAAFGETCHPSIGPVAEAKALYVEQLQLLPRVQAQRGEFVVWDVGLGGAANALTIIRATQELECSLRLVSFDNTVEPLQFALQHTAQLDYLQGYESHLQRLVVNKQIAFQQGHLKVSWELHVADFPALVAQATAATWPKPDAILFDPFSPARNPAMWTQTLFANLFRLLHPERPCAMPTYSRSTLLRVTLLLAGFFVGRGHATGQKEETTIAANTLALISEPLNRTWLERARRSNSAEPLWEPVYRQAALSPATWERLKAHPQFSGQ